MTPHHVNDHDHENDYDHDHENDYDHALPQHPLKACLQERHGGKAQQSKQWELH